MPFRLEYSYTRRIDGFNQFLGGFEISGMKIIKLLMSLVGLDFLEVLENQMESLQELKVMVYFDLV